MPANSTLQRRIEIEINRKRTAFRKNNHVKIVLDLVSEAMGVTRDEVISGNGRKNERVIAIGFCAYYLHYIFGYDMAEQVSYMIDQDVWTCYKHSKKIKSLKPSLPNDLKLLQIKEVLDKQIMDAVYISKKTTKKSI